MYQGVPARVKSMTRSSRCPGAAVVFPAFPAPPMATDGRKR